MRGGKHVKVKKRRRQDILRFRAAARKLILGSIGTPLDHLSVKGVLHLLPIISMFCALPGVSKRSEQSEKLF